jgi:hypothetical protein
MTNLVGETATPIGVLPAHSVGDCRLNQGAADANRGIHPSIAVDGAAAIVFLKSEGTHLHVSRLDLILPGLCGAEWTGASASARQRGRESQIETGSSSDHLRFESWYREGL